MDLTTSYKVLGINPQADATSVKRAYKAQVRRWHPDQFPEGSSLKVAAEEQLKQINIAYARVKAHLALHRPDPDDRAAQASPPPSPDGRPDHEAPSGQGSRRSWLDHLFDTLNAFTSTRPDGSQTSSNDRKTTRTRQTFEDVLEEMTGSAPLPDDGRKRTAGRYPRHPYAEIYKKYRRQGGSVSGVDPMEDQGPVKPVSRIRGIGRRR